jgi:RNA polymerase I-specific transcription initiation factor RRN7
LETVVKDLWSLKLRLGHTEKEDEQAGFTATASTVGFSTSEEDTDGGSVSATSKWSRKKKGKRQKLPKLVETLGLCYLGLQLLRLPVGLGEVCKWAAEEEMVYSRVVSVALIFGCVFADTKTD